MVTFTPSATLTPCVNPPVSSRPDPVWKDRMWDTYLHISSRTAGNIFSKRTSVKNASSMMPRWQRMAGTPTNVVMVSSAGGLLKEASGPVPGIESCYCE